MAQGKKRRHHYVWRYYLEAWAPGGKITCYQDGEIFAANPTKVAVEKDFYRLRELTDDDRRFVKAAIDAATDETVKKANAAWLPMFEVAFRLRDLLEEQGTAAPRLRERVATAIQNVEEDIHGQLEAEAVGQLDALRAGRPQFLASDKERAIFLHFLAMQMLRTKKGQDRVVQMTKEIVESPSAPGRINMDAVWPVLRHVLATNMGFYLYMHWHALRCRLIESPGSGEFITADQPVLNLAAGWSPSTRPPNELDLLYPVSPRRALRLELDDPKGGVEMDVASEFELDWWNQRTFRQRGRQAFATGGALLSVLAKGEHG